jgi:dihydrofolate reductase
MAGPDQSLEAPLGVGGEQLHDWAMSTECMRELHGLEGGDVGVDDEWARLALDRVGATIMGRNMFGPVRGPWKEEEWVGWWGDAPPFHHPVFILTSHPRPSLVMDGGTTFHFVTEGIAEALRLARIEAGDLAVRVAGGASTLGQFLGAELIDELHVAVVPILLGSGERLFADGVIGLPGAYACERFEATARVIHTLLVRKSVAT